MSFGCCKIGEGFATGGLDRVARGSLFDTGLLGRPQLSQRRERKGSLAVSGAGGTS